MKKIFFRTNKKNIIVSRTHNQYFSSLSNKRFWNKFIMTKFFLWALFSLTLLSQASAYDIEYKKNIALNEEFFVSVEKLENELKEEGKENISFEWELAGAGKKTGNIFERSFEKSWEKTITLNIYEEIEDENAEIKKNLISSEILDVLVYEKSVPFIFDEDIWEAKKDDFIDIGKKSGIYLHYLDIGNVKTWEIKNIQELLKNYKETTWGIKSDYLIIWGEKDFLFSLISKMNEEIEQNLEDKINLVLISSFNIDVLKNYFKNLVLWSNWIEGTFLLNESARFQIIKSPESFVWLEEYLIKSEHEYIDVNKENTINKFMFISQFIRNLSELGFSSNDIYLILIIPFLLTGIAFFKHIIWVSSVGIIIPIAITLLFFKLDITSTFIFLGVILIFNFILGKLLSQYNLLYIPKISMIIIFNFIIIILLINTLLFFNMIHINSSDMIFIFLFIIISERLISTIISKELREYKTPLFNTIILGFLGFALFRLSSINVFIFAYPEILLILIFVNYFIGRFTGLRISEYLRFKEVIKSIEE